MKEAETIDSSSSPRLFTLEEARSTLQEIEPLVAEMKTLFTRIRREIADASTVSGVPPGNENLSGHLQSRGIAPPMVERVNELIRHIHQRGCVVNGPEAGLVDFPALLGSEIVFLCWKHGEDAIGHWHRISDGFAGRKPLLDLEGSGSESADVH